MKIFFIIFFFILNISSTFAQEILSNVAIGDEIISTTNPSNLGFLDDFYVGTDAVETPTVETESPAMTLLRIAIITGILAFLTWIVLRFFFRRNALSLSTAGKSIEVLATIPAGLGSYFVIAKLSTLYYLCSLSNDGLRLLDKITDQEAIDFIELNKAQTLPQDIQFVDLLENLPEGKTKNALEFLREKVDQLKKK